METTGRELQIMHFIQPEDSMKRIPARIKNRRAAQRRRQDEMPDQKQHFHTLCSHSPCCIH